MLSSWVELLLPNRVQESIVYKYIYSLDSSCSKHWELHPVWFLFSLKTQHEEKRSINCGEKVTVVFPLGVTQVRR